MSDSNAATNAYRNRLFVGVGPTLPDALTDAGKQVRAAGFASAEPVGHRFVPKDTDWTDTDWTDTDWTDTDWTDTDWTDTHWHTVLVHARGKTN